MFYPGVIFKKTSKVNPFFDHGNEYLYICRSKFHVVFENGFIATYS